MAPQRRLTHLAYRVAGQCLHEHDRARDLIARQGTSAVRQQRGLSDPGAGPPHDEGAAYLAPARIRHADHRRLGHRWMAVENVFHG